MTGGGNFTGKSLIHDRGVKQQLPYPSRIPLESSNIPFPAVHRPPNTSPARSSYSRLQADSAPTINYLPVASPSVSPSRHPGGHSIITRSAISYYQNNRKFLDIETDAQAGRIVGWVHVNDISSFIEMTGQG